MSGAWSAVVPRSEGYEAWSWGADATLWHMCGQQGHTSIPEWRQDFGSGDTVGMRLDLSRGTLSAYLNGGRLGYMAMGLSGEFCWAADLVNEGDEVAVERAEISSFSEEETDDSSGESSSEEDQPR
jgi:hypothetical protein